MANYTLSSADAQLLHIVLEHLTAVSGDFLCYNDEGELVGPPNGVAEDLAESLERHYNKQRAKSIIHLIFEFEEKLRP